MGWELIALWVISTILSYALAPKPDEPDAGTIGDFQVPTADPNRSMPVVFGTVWVRDPNIVWYGDLLSTNIEEDGGWFNDDVTIGWRYYMGVHASLCYPVDRILAAKLGDHLVWEGDTVDGPIDICRPTLFGDEDREGGIIGRIQVLSGAANQPVNDYLSLHQGDPIPAYRGALSMVFRGNPNCNTSKFYWGNSKSIQNPSFKVQRTDMQTDFEESWLLAKANINGDMNPAHMIRECIIAYSWGMCESPSQIDDVNFTAAANTLFDEGFGLSMKWSGSEDIDSFITTIGEHIGGIPDVDPETNLFTLTLVRDDYVVDDLLLLDESNSELASFERKGWGDTVNEVVVVYTDTDTGNDMPTAPIQDPGNIRVQGSVSAESYRRPGIRDPDLANTVAKGLLRSKAAPLAKIELANVSRVAYALRRGQVFKYSNTLRGMNQVVYRVADISRGSLESGGLSITAVEDVFGMDAGSYINPQPSGWVPPTSDPVPALYERVVEASYWDVMTVMSAADMADLGAAFGFVLTQAARATGDTTDYQIHSREGIDEYAYNSRGQFCGVAQLDGALLLTGAAMTDAVVSFKNGSDLELVTVGRFAYIEDECIAVTAIDATLNTITVDRGVLDTVPAEHADSAQIWFAERRQGSDALAYASGDVVDTKILTTTWQGTLDILEAAELPLVISERYQRPYPPGNLTINGSSYPAAITGDLVISGRHRDRTQQLDYLHTQIEGNIGPELGTTYNIRIYGETDILLHTETGLITPDYTYTLLQEIEDSGLPDEGGGGGGGGASYFASILADSPEIYYRLGESSGPTAVDASGNGNHGTYSSTGITYGVTGLQISDEDTAIVLDPSTDTSQIDTGVNTNYTSECTLELLVVINLTQSDTFASLISKSGYYAPTIADFPISISHTGGVLSFQVSYGNDWNYDLQLSSTISLAEPHHVAAVYRGSGQCELWIDGVMVDSGTLTSIISVTTQNWIIGAPPTQFSGGVGNGRLAGTVDEVAIYSTALSAARIEAHAAAVDAILEAFRPNENLRVEVESERDTLLSTQMHNISFDRDAEPV